MNNSKEIDQEYLKLMKLFYAVGDHKRGETVTEQDRYLFEVEALTAKLFYHIGTVRYLWLGTQVTLPGDQPRLYVDHSSISVVVRAAFETYLTFYFIYCDLAVSEAEKELRYTSWRLGGLLDRQNFKAVSEGNIPKLELEKKEVDKLISEIESNPIFKGLEKKFQKTIKKGEWRQRKSWSDLSGVAGFNKEIFKDVYSYLCSYAHSGGLSALQIGQAVDISAQQELSNISIQYGLVIMSHFIQSYVKLFPKSKKVLASHQQLKPLVNKWHITWKEDAFLKQFSHNKRLNTDKSPCGPLSG